MRVALDTNRYVDFCRGDRQAQDLLETASLVYLPLIVLAELRAGFAVGTRSQSNERALRGFLRKPGVEILHPTESTTLIYASLYRQLRSQGTPIPTNDLWTAALVVEHNLVLCSRDEHFHRLAQLEIV